MTKDAATSHDGREPGIEVVSLTTLADRHLVLAREAGSGRSAQGLSGGRDQLMRQTLIALAAGRELGEHESPGEAILQVLMGRVRLSTSTGDSAEAQAGSQIAIPPLRHDLAALEDAVVLLTVVSR